MEPLSTGTAALASIIGLIGQFKSGRDSAKSQDFNEFMQWLAESNHAELKSLIEQNQGTTISIKAILHQSQEVLSESLSRIDDALAAITSALSGFGELSKSIRPDAVLSDQAIWILKQFKKTGTSKLSLQIHYGFKFLVPLDGLAGKLPIKEPNFLTDDIRMLCEAKLLIPETDKKGEPIWHYTRQAEAFIASLPD
ncbi:hypothetical protein [Ectopseudomonas khazarica]|uniref:hypothetical protein n=1 Tax=Ectopseudomonas khazarica TaxID=2502979 RepID=UPI00106E6BCC|nr:hypothetical protein [Pseudomonas khazarica]